MTNYGNKTSNFILDSASLLAENSSSDRYLVEDASTNEILAGVFLCPIPHPVDKIQSLWVGYIWKIHILMNKKDRQF